MRPPSLFSAALGAGFSGLAGLAGLLALLALPAPAVAAPKENPALVARVAFGSCARSEKPQPVWDAVMKARPDAFIMLGDNVYGDTEDMRLLRGKYARQDAVPGFAKMRRRTVLLGTWDDHDYGVNDGGAGYPKRAESREAFLDFFREPAGTDRRAREGVYDAMTWGPPGRRVQIILLDTRYFRSPLRRGEGGYLPDDDPAKTMLGEAQWEWLERRLREPAEVRLLVSSIQVVAEEHPFEKWANLPRERERLFALIRSTGAAGVIVLSGDRHFAELSVADAGLGYPLHDLTSSPLAARLRDGLPPDINRHRTGAMNWDENFGLVDIDWERDDPVIRLEIRDAGGEVAVRKKLVLSDLRPYVIDRLPLMLWGRPVFGMK